MTLRQTLASSALACLPLATLLTCQAAAQSDLPEILRSGSDLALPDFSYAGYSYGLAAIPNVSGTIIDPADYGAVPDDGKDDSAAIVEAVEAANATEGPVTIRFAPGRFIVSELIKIERSDLTLQGAGRGEGGTELHMPRPLAMVGDSGKLDELRDYLVKYDKRQRQRDDNIDALFSEYSWSGGFIWVGKADARPAPYLEEFDKKPRRAASGRRGQAGGRELTVEDAGNIAAGERIEILWYNRAGEDGSLIDAIYGETDLEIGSHHWEFQDRPLARIRTTVESVDGDTLMLASPLLHDVSDALPVDVAKWSPLERVGIEDLKLSFPDAIAFGHHLERGYNGIYLTGVADSWITDVTVSNSDAGILTYDAANVTIRDVRTDGERVAHYSVHMGNVHNVLAERIVVANPAIHSLSFNTQSTKSVYKHAEVLRAAVLDQHAGANHQNLFDNPTLRITATMDEGGEGASYKLWDGSGAGYWQPGHGAYNTTWNARVIVEGGAPAGMPITLQGLAEGPSARIVGVHGNREFKVDYRPEPYIEMTNEAVTSAPSLYDWQLAQRRKSMTTGGD